MRDLLFVVAAITFFGLAGRYVTACDRLVGRDRVESLDHDERASR